MTARQAYTHTRMLCRRIAMKLQSEGRRAYLLCARNWLHFTLSVLSSSPPPPPPLPFSPRILESVYIRYPIVLPRVIVARDINADIRRGLANMSHRGAFLRAFTSMNLCDTALRTRWERLIN